MLGHIRSATQFLLFYVILTPMNIDPTSQALALQQFQTQTKANIIVMKKQFEMDKMLVEMIDAVSQSAALPAGQGTRVDKSV